MAKKKSSTKTTPIRIDSGLVKKMETIAKDKGLDLSDYATAAIRPAVDRDWLKVLKKLAEDVEAGSE